MPNTSSIGPTREPEHPKEPQTKSTQKIIDQYLEYLQINTNKNALKKYEEIIETLISKIASDISQEGGKLVDIHIDSATGEVKVLIREGLKAKWEKTQELQNLFSDISKSLISNDKDKTLTALLQIAKAQIDPKSAAHPSYQKAFNTAMKEVFQGEDSKNKGATEDYTLRLYMIQMGQKASKKWGDNIPGMKQELLAKLENQLSTTEDTATPFKDAAESLASEVANMNEPAFKNFISKDNEEVHKKLLFQMIMDSMIAPKLRAMLQKNTAQLDAESKDKDKAENEISIQTRKDTFLKTHISDKIFDKEVDAIKRAIAELEKSSIDPKTIQELKQQLEAAVGTRDLNDLLNVVNSIGKAMNFSAFSKDRVDDHKLKALEYLKQCLKDLPITSQDAIDELNAQIKEIEKSINKLSPTEKLIDEINALLEKKSMSSADYAKLMENYIKLSNCPEEFKDQVAAVKKAIQTATVQSETGGTKVPLLDKMASCYFAQNIPHPPISEKDVKAWISQAKAQIEKLAKDYPQAQETISALKNFINSSYHDIDGTSQYCIDPCTGQSLFTTTPGKCTINGDYSNTKGLKINDLDQISQIVSSQTNYIKDKLKSLRQNLKSYELAFQEAREINSQMGKINQLMNMLTKGINEGKSVTDLFIDVILGDYTLFLEMGLRLLANQLNLRTSASKSFQDAASKITDWANIKKGLADGDIGFEKWFNNYKETHKEGSKEPFNIKEVQERLQKEMDKLDQVKIGGDECNASLQKFIDSKKAELSKTPPPSPEEIKEIKSEIEKAEGKIDAVKKNMESVAKLKADLSAVKDALAKTPAMLPADISKLLKDKGIDATESIVVDGHKDTDPKKSVMGLSELVSDIQATAKDYGGQGEELQMKLGRSFNNMQMIYTTITSCIQILNRMASAPITAMK